MRHIDVLPYSSTYHCRSVGDYCNISGEGREDFEAMAAFDAKKLETEEGRDQFPSITENLCMEENGDEEDDGDFSFVCLNATESPISADDVFQNGQIRPIFPIFNRNGLISDSSDCDRESKEMAALRSPLRKVFVKESDDVSFSSASESDELEGLDAGTYCEWSPKVFEVSPELSKKSNSTGFCKLWRFRNLVHRSKSDGKDAFIFLNKTAATKSPKAKRDAALKNAYTEQEKKSVKAKVKVKKGGKGPTTTSAHERHYVRNRAKKEEDKRRSYLPYRQDLVGFFTSVNGFSRNIHPF